MQRNPVTIFLWVLASLLFWPFSVCAMDVNQFYQRFVDHLKASRYAQIEQLVRENRVEAEKSLGIIRGKIQNENDLQRKDALTMISNELEELLAVTTGGKDCALADRIVSRGKQTALPEEGLEAYYRAVKLCSDNADAILGLAELNQRQGNFEEATSSYEKVIALNPDNSDALLGMGEVLYSAGLYERGVPYLERVLKIDPDNKKATRLLESCTKQIALGRDGIIPAAEISDRLWSSLEGNLMCMCPSHAKLVSRVRLRAITFDTESVKLNHLAREQLSELAQALSTEALRGGRYLIEGYADPTGGAEYNRMLSGLRAEAVKRYLVISHKVNPDLLTTSGVGSSRSWTNNDTSAGRRANRRIEIISLGAPGPANQQR